MNLVYIVIVLSIIGILCMYYHIHTKDAYIVRIKRNQITDFKTSLDLVGLPIITFYQGDKKYNFLIDSGSNLSYINQASSMDYQLCDDKDVFMGVNGTDISCQYANIKLYKNNIKYEIKVAIADLSVAIAELKSNYGVTLTGIIGCDFMSKYSYCIDFKESIIYIRKLYEKKIIQILKRR